MTDPDPPTQTHMEARWGRIAIAGVLSWVVIAALVWTRWLL